MDTNHIAFIVGVATFAAAAFAYFAFVPFSQWWSSVVVGGLAEQAAAAQRAKLDQGKAVDPKLLDPKFHRPGAWFLTVLLLLVVLGFGLKLTGYGDKSNGVDGETLAKGYFARQVIRCYAMSDPELAMNETLCRDALRRMNGYR